MAWLSSRMDILLLGSSLKSKLVACPLTQVPPATGDTWTHRCDIREQNVSECVRMTHWEGDCPFLIISPMFYVPNSSFVPHRKTEISTHCACGVTGFSWDTLLDTHSTLHQKVIKDLHGLLPGKVQIVRTCSAGTDSLTCGALAAQICYRSWWLSRNICAKFCNTEEAWVKLNSVLIIQISWQTMTEIIF